MLYSHCKGFTWLFGYKYTSVCTLYLFVIKDHRYVPVKLRKLSGHMTDYALQGSLTQDEVGLVRNCCWDTLEIRLDKIALKRNEWSVSLSTVYTIPIADKIRMRRVMGKSEVSFKFMIRQGSNWYCIPSTKRG